MLRAATLSDDNQMRWTLERIWTPTPSPYTLRICVFIMLNPSSADASNDDPTVGRCVAFAKSWGYDGLRIVNLVSYRSTKPAHMHTWFVRQLLPDLHEHARVALFACQRPDVAKVVVAHGVLPAFMRKHAYFTLSSIQKYRNLHAIKLNGDGSPAHPLYLKGDLRPRLYFV